VNGAVAIVLAAGSGERFQGSLPKALVPVAGRSMVVRAVERARACAGIGSVVVVAPLGFEDEVREGLSDVVVVTGGSSRHASVRCGLDAVPDEAPAVVCHDAARALATTGLFDRVLAALDGWDGVVPVVPVVDTVKRVSGERVEGTEAREALSLAQTPQAFVTQALRAAHRAAERDGLDATDDALLLERAGYRVRAIEGERLNLKITTPDDLRLAEAIEAAR
jgi:2-C-methyl-D-erythritol 4-phosphate cytidylyltransferase